MPSDSLDLNFLNRRLCVGSVGPLIIHHFCASCHSCFKKLNSPSNIKAVQPAKRGIFNVQCAAGCQSIAFVIVSYLIYNGQSVGNEWKESQEQFVDQEVKSTHIYKRTVLSIPTCSYILFTNIIRPMIPPIGEVIM